MAELDSDIAIIGMAARFPGARSIEGFWHNLRNGVESVRALSDDELRRAGVTAAEINRPGYVKAAADLADMDLFDAEFFGFSPLEAAIMDPQHRQFLEATWEALEDAAHPPDRFEGAIGVFAGCGMNGYFIHNVLTNHDLVRDVGLFLLRHTGNDKDFLATRASYLLDLRGPSVNVQTACSTSLVATHLACQHLLSGECDLALAGGATIEFPHGRGYQFVEGEILSPDGHCRAFDAGSQGTVFGSGAGVVVLRRLRDALDDCDRIYAVIKATAVNNDGSRKVGYLAPSVDGQAACISEALAMAAIDPETVGYIECHGTGTPMGDPIEVAALTQAFREFTDKTGFCALGSVKTNIGHLDTAAGVASLIKVALSLSNAEIPASLHFEEPNPALGLEGSPFFVNDRLRGWASEGTARRRAGVNSLGVGGTNAFALLEESPPNRPVPATDGRHLLTISARTRAGLDANTDRLAAHLVAHPDLDLGDVAWTLRHGRRGFRERRVLVAGSTTEAGELLRRANSAAVFSARTAPGEGGIAFMFPGGGAQYPQMAHDLYRSEPLFAAHVDAGLELLRANHGLDLAPILYCADTGREAAAVDLERPSVQLPAIFLVEFALAQLLIDRGVTPSALLGHSVGENTAACVAGTMSFADCLGLVALRGRLMDITAGAMAIVPASADSLTTLLDEHGLDLAVINAADLSVVSGDARALARMEDRLRTQGVEPQRVRIATAAHSRQLDPVLGRFREYLGGIALNAPRIPWVSNRTGTWITDEQAQDPEYWVGHLRDTVRFSDCIATLGSGDGRVLLEVGPGTALCSLAKLDPVFRKSQAALPTLGHADVDDNDNLLLTIGRLWAVGADAGVERVFAGRLGRRVGLPTYAFQSQPFFLQPGQEAVRSAQEEPPELVERAPQESRWFWEPVWKHHDAPEPIDGPVSWLVFCDRLGVANELIERLTGRGERVVTVRFGDAYAQPCEGEYVIAAEEGRFGYDQLVGDLVRGGRLPDRVVHLSLLATEEDYRPGSSFLHRNLELGLFSLVNFAQAWAAHGCSRPLHIVIGTSGAQRVLATDRAPWPEQSTVLGPARVLPHELADVTVCSVDLEPGQLREPTRWRTALGRRSQHSRKWAIDALHREVLAPAHADLVAWRDGQRLVRSFRRGTVADVASPGIAPGSVVLITGGVGGIGSTLARHLAGVAGVRLVLLSRSALPERKAWADIVQRLGPNHPTSVRIGVVSELEAKGAQVFAVTGDVTDAERMLAVVGQIRDRYGRLDWVIHAAGVVDDALIAVKSQPELERVLAPKLYGTLHLDQATSALDLQGFIVLSSVSTITGPAGQVDYVAANAFVESFVQSRNAASDRRRYRAISWGTWNSVGMTATPPPGGSAVQLAGQEWLSTRAIGEDGVIRFGSRWNVRDRWFLDEHRTAAGEALLPGAAYLELVRQALADSAQTGSFELRDLSFIRPLAAAPDDATEAMIRLTPNESGYQFDVSEAVTLDTGAPGAGPARTGWRRTAEASVLLGTLEPPADLDLEALWQRCTSDGPTRTRQQDHLSFGPRWDVVRKVGLGTGIAIGDLELPDRFVSDLATVQLHPALIDLGTGFAMDLIEGYTGDTLWVPVGYRRVCVYDKLTADVVSCAWLQPGSTESSASATFDVMITDRRGRVLIQIDGCVLRRLDADAALGLHRRALPADVEFDIVSLPSGVASPAAALLAASIERGITPEEGTRTFDTLLRRTDAAWLVVTPFDPEALLRESDAVARLQTASASAEPGQLFGRPLLDSDYLEPRSDLERGLVGLWQELLGVDQIGVRDSFFDLGGHSIIAVRFFAKLKRTYGVDLPLSVLLTAPTVEACAALIGEMLDPAAADPSATAAGGSTPATRSYVVAMHPGGDADATPFFMAAGMFGNVLNLRPLANLIGLRRPFYGIQARGLFGDSTPHETFEEMARAYLSEIRDAQPHGPYLLGGFSGGGVVAFEMARQLRASGETVALLVLLDTPAPLPRDHMTVPERARFQFENLRRNGVGYLTTWASARLKWQREVRRRRRQPEGMTPTTLHSPVIEAAFYRALASYELRRYDGVVTLFRPKLRPTHIFSPQRQVDENRNFLYHDNRWSPFCDRVEVAEVPGNHDSMVLEPNVRVLAAHIGQQISAALAPRDARPRELAESAGG